MSDEFDDPTPPAAPPPQHSRLDLGSVDDALAAGVPAAKFETVGTIIKGTIVSAEMAQQRDLATGKPKFWEDGNPCTQILITLATADRSADIDDDDGHRRLYVKRPSAMLKAIAAALGKLKLSQAIGGTLAVKYTGDGEATQRGFSKPKLFAAKFTPPGATQIQQPAAQTGNYPEARVAAVAAFKASLPPGTTGEEAKPTWLALLAKVCPGKKVDQITAAEWEKVKMTITGYDPAMDEAPMDDSQIPF